MPKFKHGSGTIYQRTKTGPDGKKRILKTWWLDYSYEGKRIRESSGTTDKAEARKFLQSRLGEVADERYVGLAAERVTFDDLAEMLLTDYKVNEKKSLADTERRVRKHLSPFFGGQRAHDIKSADVQSYVAHRKEQGASNAEINRELAALKRAFNLALQSEKITKKPRSHPKTLLSVMRAQAKCTNAV